MQQTLKKTNRPKSERVVQGFIIGFLLLFTLMCLLPFLNILGSSFASSSEIATRTFIIIPREFSLNAYRVYSLDTHDFYEYWRFPFRDHRRNGSFNDLDLFYGLCSFEKIFAWTRHLQLYCRIYHVV